MKILVACEFSGVVREAFHCLGHEAVSCDFDDTEIPGEHYIGDVADIIDEKWDMMIAHPPCTYICNTAVSWLYRGTEEQMHIRRINMELASRFFKLLMEVKHIPKICIENPIPHKYALDIIGKKYAQIIQPWQFGYGETKATCLWLKGLPKLTPSNIVTGREQKIFNMSPSKNRSKNRSRTCLGIAKAMADQWGTL